MPHDYSDVSAEDKMLVRGKRKIETRKEDLTRAGRNLLRASIRWQSLFCAFPPPELFNIFIGAAACLSIVSRIEHVTRVLMKSNSKRNLLARYGISL